MTNYDKQGDGDDTNVTFMVLSIYLCAVFWVLMR